MNPTTREMVRLALSNDHTVSTKFAEAVFDMLDGRSLQSHAAVPDHPLLMTMTAAANLLGVSRVTMWRMVKEGVVQPVEITPRVFRIRRQDVQDLASKRSRYKPAPRGHSAV